MPGCEFKNDHGTSGRLTEGGALMCCAAVQLDFVERRSTGDPKEPDRLEIEREFKRCFKQSTCVTLRDTEPHSTTPLASKLRHSLQTKKRLFPF